MKMNICNAVYFDVGSSGLGGLPHSCKHLKTDASSSTGTNIAHMNYYLLVTSAKEIDRNSINIIIIIKDSNH